MRKPGELPKEPPRLILTLVFSVFVFIIMSITMLIMGCIAMLLRRLGISNLFSKHTFFTPAVGYAISSIIISTLVATCISRIPLKPVNKIINGMNKLANGEYKTRIKLGNQMIAKEISDSFNTLACELDNTEVLRSDFINNFSHEFKTPIVSILGFAKLLQKDTIGEKEKKEYLSIIIEESARLSDMATNVLSLTKVENQKILTDLSELNLSEQIRTCILVLENKWQEKNLVINAEFFEYKIQACEELLKQVWINLLHNAIKFSPTGGQVGISISEEDEEITVSILNNGPQMSQEEIKYVFNKFWQGDTSHASEGTGIGLSIAKRVVELHKGRILITSTEQETVFIVKLPKYKR